MLDNKLNTLLKIQEKKIIFKIPKFINFTVSEWNISKKDIIKKIFNFFNKNNIKLLAIRSASVNEDNLNQSMAGAFDSFLNIKINSTDIINAVEKVIRSYDNKNSYSKNNSVIVQEMINNISMSGVVFTYDLNSGAPYYCINYDDVSGKTNTVTSGDSEYSNKNLYIYREKTELIQSKRFINLIKAIKNLEKVIENHHLDIEFAVNQKNIPYLLQVRPITTFKLKPTLDSKNLKKYLSLNYYKLEKYFSKKNISIHGKFPILGQMPDWNPVEMIGTIPNQLSYSLYKKLITNNTWSTSREIMGYKKPNNKNLMLNIMGQPFIDTRLSFNSFLHKNLNKKISEKLLDIWLSNLKQFPHLHDKIEFEIAITCFDFSLKDKLNSKKYNRLTNYEKVSVYNCYKKQFISFFDKKNKSSISSSLKKIEYLDNFNLKINSNTKSLNERINKCINFGTIPFSILARHGFVAKSILDSLVSKKILTKKDIENFYSSLNTITSHLLNDIKKLNKSDDKKMNFNEFISKYGHLRPGSYNILSKKYANFKISDFNKNNNVSRKKVVFKINNKKRILIDALLKKEGISGIDSYSLENYCSEAIKAREYSKFVFTKTLSNILDYIVKIGKDNKITKKQLSYLDLRDILKLEDKKVNKSKLLILNNKIKKMKSINDAYLIARLPSLILSRSNVYIIPYIVAVPNFITQKKIISEIIYLEGINTKTDLNNKIILIEGADPGYDWIFSSKISGLITKFGGANSHMAIRCAELKIPAAIGCGNQTFDKILKGNKVILDCSLRNIEVS